MEYAYGKRTNADTISDARAVINLPHKMTSFLQDIAYFGVTHGNSPTYGLNFGKGYNVMSYKPLNDGAGGYGRNTKLTGCIYGRELVLVNMKSMVETLNRKSGRDKYDYKEMMTFVESKFREARVNGDGLVLAPSNYRVSIGINNIRKDGYYTAFNKEKLIDLVPAFINLLARI